MSQPLTLGPDLAAAHRIVELACRAPSVHNTQPWTWHVTPDTIELHADWTRRLPLADPDGRNLVISCGAALHHVQVAAAALGFACDVVRAPEPTRSQHLATVHLTPADPAPGSECALRAVELRATDRRRFTDWPIPDDRLTKVAASVTQDGVRGVVLTDVSARFRVELLISRAMTRQHSDDGLFAEQQLWLDRSARDGIPVRAMPRPEPGPRNQVSRYTPDLVAEGQPDVRIGSDGLIVIGTGDDDRGAWLRTGEALSALWLHATLDGLSVVPLSQVIEVDETRQSLCHEVLDGVMTPQILVRIGWQEIGLSQRPRTPRRPIDDVLLP